MFQGFDRTAPQFFHELAVEMSKPWFEANKQRYLDLWVTPLTELLETVAQKLAKTYAPQKLGTKIFRIYRDTRFAKDKTPYKTNIAGLVTLGDASERASAMYVHIGIDEEYLGSGKYFFDDRQLARWRKAIAADKTGKPLATLVGKLRKAGYDVGGDDDYRRVPKPYDADHPRAEFLKMRGLTAGFPEMPRGMLHQAKLVDWLVEHGRATAPLVTWLARTIK